MVWPTPAAPPPADVGPVADERMVAGPLDGRTAAWLTVGDAAARVRVRFARLPGLLYRISTASDAGLVPVVSRRDGRVTLRLNEADGDGLDEVRIVLNRNVRWDIRLPAGAGEQQLNLRDGRVHRVEVGSAGLAEVWLPEPDGTVPVVFTGGIGTAVVSVRRGTPVRIHLTQGAGSVETPWIANNGTAAGTVLREPDFQEALDRYAIRADGGIGALVLRRPADRDPLDAPEPATRQPGPAIRRPAPNPAVEQPNPAGQHPKPAGQHPKPAAEQPKRSTDQRKPARKGQRPGSAPAPDQSARKIRRTPAQGQKAEPGRDQMAAPGKGQKPASGKGQKPAPGKGQKSAPGNPRPGTQSSRPDRDTAAAEPTGGPAKNAPGKTADPLRNGGSPGDGAAKGTRSGVAKTPKRDRAAGDHRISPEAGIRSGVSPAGPS
ncbi:hypothetical protein [Actinoplanes sp. NPDC026670]|uniref:hypothetical protein n=1 Tax=Actinoplanes sp. NPDC026670 TaxID=3154700 RepID=UPI0033E83424